MIVIERLDHIQICIPVGAEDQARRFYTEIIGFKEINKPEALIPNGGLWYEVADIQFHIGVENGINNSKRHPAFRVKNLADCRKYLIEQGVRIKEDIAISGMDRFSFFDPFNNRFELLQYKDL